MVWHQEAVIVLQCTTVISNNALDVASYLNLFIAGFIYFISVLYSQAVTCVGSFTGLQKSYESSFIVPAGPKKTGPCLKFDNFCIFQYYNIHCYKEQY